VRSATLLPSHNRDTAPRARNDDPRDRRITRVLPTAGGAALVDELLQYRNEVLTAILSRLDPDQLQTVEAAFKYLLEAATKLEAERRAAEAVA